MIERLDIVARKSNFIHPLVIFLLVWALVIGLYTAHLSELLLYSPSEVLEVTAWVVLPYCITIAFLSALRGAMVNLFGAKRHSEPIVQDAVASRIRWWFGFWVSITLVEIVVSGGLPIVWLIRGSAKTYFDFGIPSVHGLMNSLLLSIGLVHVALFALGGRLKNLWIPGWVVCWSFLAVTRNMMTVFLIEAAFVWVLLRGIRWRTGLRAVAGLILAILLFGYLGDLRSGAEAFRALAQPTSDYPEWLPSGVLWVYIYLTTPIGNLVNTTLAVHPLNSFLFPNTTSLLFPTVLRTLLYGKTEAATAFGGELVTNAFNVSTAFVGPYQDFGKIGIALFSAFFGGVASYFWSRDGLKGALFYAVVAQCIVLSVFFDHLLYLPVISQVFWLWFFLRPVRAERWEAPKE
jgi:oligosaccharide repeat unit polymerase